MMSLAKELFKYGAIAAILAYLLFKIIMPLVKTMMQPPPASPTRQLGGNINIIDEEDGQTAPPSAVQALEQKLGKRVELAQQDPKVVANIIKDCRVRMPADDGIEKSAILLIALGEDYASEVLKHLGPKEVQKLGHAMAALKTVPQQGRTGACRLPEDRQRVSRGLTSIPKPMSAPF